MEPAESVKKLGVILDAENSMQRHNAIAYQFPHLNQINAQGYAVS